jgi:hypothetical protein
MPLVLNGATSGSTTLQATDAVTVTCTLPSTGGTLQTSGSGYTANGVAYASSTSALATGSSLVWTGSALGIGTSSPSATLEVNGAIKLTSGNFSVAPTTTTNAAVTICTNGGGTFFAGLDNSAGGTFGVGNYSSVLYNGANTPMVFFTNATEKMRLTSLGQLLIGTSSSNGTGITVFPNSGSPQIVMNASTVTNVDFYFQYASGTVGSISTTTTTTSYNVTSDYRLKENIAPMTGALAKVSQLKPVTYNWKSEPDEIAEGFIAHELAEVVPHAVTGEKDATKEEEYEITPAVKDEEGNITTPAVMGTRTVPVYQGIDTSFLIATLTAAIQELNTLITAQSTTIQSLTDRITALEAK